jgi:hypothetical protein
MFTGKSIVYVGSYNLQFKVPIRDLGTYPPWIRATVNGIERICGPPCLVPVILHNVLYWGVACQLFNLHYWKKHLIVWQNHILLCYFFLKTFIAIHP